MSTKLNNRRTVVPRRRMAEVSDEPQNESVLPEETTHSVPVLLRLPNLAGQLLASPPSVTAPSEQLSTTKAESTTADLPAAPTPTPLPTPQTSPETTPSTLGNHDSDEASVAKRGKELQPEDHSATESTPTSLLPFDWKQIDQWIGSSQGKLVAIGLLLAASVAVFVFTKNGDTKPATDDQVVHGDGKSEDSTPTLGADDLGDAPYGWSATQQAQPTAPPAGENYAGAKAGGVQPSFNVPPATSLTGQNAGHAAGHPVAEQAIGPPNQPEGERVSDARGAAGFGASVPPVPATPNSGVSGNAGIPSFNIKPRTNIPPATPTKPPASVNPALTPGGVSVPNGSRAGAGSTAVVPPARETGFYNAGSATGPSGPTGAPARQVPHSSNYRGTAPAVNPMSRGSSYGQPTRTQAAPYSYQASEAAAAGLEVR